MKATKYILESPVYLSGAITNNPDYKSQFDSYKEHLEWLGYKVISPADIPIPDDIKNKKSLWEYMMREALKLMLECNSIAVIPYKVDQGGTLTHSKGVRIECCLASDLGMKLEILDEI